MLCQHGSVLSCDVSVAFMHATVARAEFVQLPNNVSTQSTGERVFVKLRKAVNGLRSAPLSWYYELSDFLRSRNFEASLDPTIFRRLTKKGLTMVLFYVDDLLIFSEDPGEGRRFYEELRQRYKLKLTGELLQDCPGEVSFLGRRIFRRKKGERAVYFGLDEQYLSSCCEEYGITKPAPKLPSLERRYAELLKKGQTELISPAAHERYRRTLGRLAWAALSRPDLQFVCGFLGRHQAAPDEAAETCMRDVLRWVKGLPHKVQVFPSKREILEDDADPTSVSCFTDASWSLNSVSGGVITWENCSLKSFSRKQTTTALSSAEAELAALTEVAREGLYIALLVETIREGMPKDREAGYYVLRGYSDSESAVCISKMQTLLRKVRHIELRAAFLQELVQRGGASYQLWLSGALSSGMGPVYRSIKSHEQTLSRPFRDQSALARAYCRMEFWSNIWDATVLPGQTSFSPERLALRAEASQQARGLAPLTFEQVKAACLGTGNKKGGLDGWSYRALRNLPDACYQQLAELFRSVELELAMPLQMRAVQVALLPKSPEKERPISLTSVLWRIFSKLRRPVLDGWIKEYVAHAPFDAATPGRTCLDPALSRLIKAEDHKFRKVTFVTLFVDLLGFYDAVDFSRLLQQGSALSFPPLLLELSLQLYTGPRCLNGEGVSTVMLHPKRGILQGCPYAPTIAKLTTHAPLQAISSEPGVSGADLWLDDITVDISHPDPEVAAAHALSVSRKLDYLLSIEKLQINKAKTKFVVNNAQAAKALNTMRGADDPEVTDLVRDLGVDSAGAKRRRVTHALKRFKVGRARNVKLHALATGGKAHRLYATSVLTAEIFGHQAQGLSPKRLKVIRASISRHVGRSRWGSVDVSLDSMSFRCQDPLLTVILAQADTLYKMFGPSTLQGWEVLSRTWRMAWNRQHAAVHGWKCVAGPVAAMIQYCLDLSIDVSDPLRWVHGGGVLSLDVTDPGLFLSVRRFLTKVVALERAARFGAVPTANGAQEVHPHGVMITLFFFAKIFHA